MPRIIRMGLDLSQGHCYNPKPSLIGSIDVFVNNLPVVRQFDSYSQIHSCGPDTHSMGIALEGSPTVFVNGLGVHRDGDKIACGDVADNGSLDVFVDENTGGSSGGTGGNTIGYTVGRPILTYPMYDILIYTNCNKLYAPDSMINGIGTLFGDLYTEITEEDTGVIFKDYSVPIKNFEVFPNLPSFLSIDPITGDLRVIDNVVPTLRTTYTIIFNNFVRNGSAQLIIEAIPAPFFGFNCG